MKDGFSEAWDELEHPADTLNHAMDSFEQQIFSFKSLSSPPSRVNERPAVSISVPLDIQAAKKWSEERTAAGKTTKLLDCCFMVR